MTEPFTLDKFGRQILPGDILKVFHFIGARRKRHYMYKQAIEYVTLNKGGVYLKISHLNRLHDEPWDIGRHHYLERADGNPMAAYEIVQSVKCDHEDRPSAPKADVGGEA